MLIQTLASQAEGSTTYAGKTLIERLTGRFYTPDVLATDLARRACAAFSQRPAPNKIRICDPFCGDGRLIVAVLSEAQEWADLRGRHWSVVLADIDAKACKAAAKLVKAAADALGVSATIRTTVADSFLATHSASYDIVVTNPPWEHLKPDAREMLHMTATEKDNYRAALRLHCAELDRAFPNATAHKQWAGWGTNLARCGLELALRSSAPHGTIAIVLPSTMFADQASMRIRRFAIDQYTLENLSSYPAEARLFARVDQPVLTAVFTNKKPASSVHTMLRMFGADQSVQKETTIRMSRAELDANDYALAVSFGAGADDIRSKLIEHGTLRDLEGELWTGREIDETRMAEKTVPGLRHPFVKGRMIERHAVREMPNSSVRAELAKRHRSVAYERIVWRDVARSSQARRMICALIPSGWVAGNSLHVAHFQDGDPTKLRALYAVMSSYVFEMQVRSRLGTGHMSLGVVRSSGIPSLTKRVQAKLAKAATEAMSGGSNVWLEVAVAKSYGLRRDEFAAILSHFTKTTASEREQLLNTVLWA